MADPITDLAAQANVAFNELNRGMSQVMAGGMKAFNEMAPHNVLAKLAPAATEGAGTFSAKMTTQQLRQRNIFGE